MDGGSSAEAKKLRKQRHEFGNANSVIAVALLGIIVQKHPCSSSKSKNHSDGNGKGTVTCDIRKGVWPPQFPNKDPLITIMDLRM